MENWTNANIAPKQDGRYLVTRYDAVTKKEFVDILWYEKGVWWNRQYTDDFRVIAYMSLPYVYKYSQYILNKKEVNV